uniref:Uncharacterized protein n=1 Tax=Cynoglossus semilaevis TaxID=244447 RepID=A0A3P8X0S7_CYNSE
DKSTLYCGPGRTPPPPSPGPTGGGGGVPAAPPSPPPIPSLAMSSSLTTSAAAWASASASAAAASWSSFCCLTWVFLWFLRLEKVLNALPHRGQTCMLWMNPFPQTSQRNGRSPECVRRCSRRCGNGRSPCSRLLCLIRLARKEKVLPQSEHWNGRSPVCVRMWLRTWSCFLKDLPQIPQTKLRSATWAVSPC